MPDRPAEVLIWLNNSAFSGPRRRRSPARPGDLAPKVRRQPSIPDNERLCRKTLELLPGSSVFSRTGVARVEHIFRRSLCGRFCSADLPRPRAGRTPRGCFSRRARRDRAPCRAAVSRRIRWCNRCRMPARRNGTARTRPGSSSSSCSARTSRATSVFHPDYAYLFNSYYVSAGPRHTRAARGLLTRPGADEVAAYRRACRRRDADAVRRGRRGDAARSWRRWSRSGSTTSSSIRN